MGPGPRIYHWKTSGWQDLGAKPRVCQQMDAGKSPGRSRDSVEALGASTGCVAITASGASTGWVAVSAPGA